MIPQTATAAGPVEQTETGTTPQDSYDRDQLATYIGIEVAEVEKAIKLGEIPPTPEPGGRWPADVAETAKARVREITTAVRVERPLGANRSALRLGRRLGLPVDRPDIEALSEAGHLAVVDEYKGWPLYCLETLDTLPAETVRTVVDQRQAWRDASLTGQAAAEHLGWTPAEVAKIAGELGFELGPEDRWHRTDIEAMAADEDLTAAVMADRRIGPQQACAHLDIRETDWRYLVDGEYVTPVEHVYKDVGRRSQVKVPLYRVGDLDQLAEHPDIDWPALRDLRPGDPSPLREVTGRKPDRAKVIKRFAADVAERWSGIEVWTSYNQYEQAWQLDWTRTPEGAPTKGDVKAMAAADPTMTPHAKGLALGTAAGDIVRWARAMMEPGVAVILDTETTSLDGAIIELSVIDAHTGKTLIDTLVRPRPEYPLHPEAHARHGLTADDLTDAPSWPKVLAKLRKATKDRQIIAWNESFDRGMVLSDTRDHNCQPKHLAERARWHCAMEARMTYESSWRMLPLCGPHRALGDCHAVLGELRAMTAPPGATAVYRGTRR